MLVLFLFFLMIRRPPRSTRTDTLFPYTTLFRSQPSGALRAEGFKAVRLARDDHTPWSKPAPAAVCDEAERWNARLDAWAARKGPHPFEDDKPAQAGKPGAQGPRKAMKPGTVDALINRYKNAHAFMKLRKSTKKMYSEKHERSEEHTSELQSLM